MGRLDSIVDKEDYDELVDAVLQLHGGPYGLSYQLKPLFEYLLQAVLDGREPDLESEFDDVRLAEFLIRSGYIHRPVLGTSVSLRGAMLQVLEEMAKEITDRISHMKEVRRWIERREGL